MSNKFGRVNQRRRSACVFQEFDRVTDSQNIFRSIVGNFAAELFLKSHDQLDRVETIRAKIVNEACVLDDLGVVNT